MTTEKEFATVRAECALARVVLVRSKDDRGRDSFIVTRQHVTREFLSLDDVRAWLSLITNAARLPTLV